MTTPTTGEFTEEAGGASSEPRHLNDVTRGRKRSFPFRFILLAIVALLFLFPIYWTIVTALKPSDAATTVPVQWWPANPTWENFQQVLLDPRSDVIRWTFNSVVTSVAQASAHVVICILAAYAFARLSFKGRDTWFWIVLASLMLPPAVILIPRYVLMLELGWIDTFHPLIWPAVSSAFGVFLLRQFFLTIPRDLEDAARIDGANILQVIWHVIIPSSVPALVTLFVFAYLFTWNDFIWPLFTVHGDTSTLPVGLSKYSSQYLTEYGKLMAATVLAALPAIIGFIFAQRYIVQGVTLSGLKE